MLAAHVQLDNMSIESVINFYDKNADIIKNNYQPYNAVIHKMEGEILADLDRPAEAEESFILALEFAEFEDDEFVVDIYNDPGFVVF